MASIQKRGVSWVANIRRKGHPSMSKSFTTKVMATQWARKVEQEMDAKSFNPNILSEMLFKDILDRYVEATESTNPMGRNKAAVYKQLRKTFGEVSIAAMSTSRIMEYLTEKLANGTGGVTLSIDLVYIKQILSTAKHLWEINTDPSAVDGARLKLQYLGVSTRSRQRDRRPTAEELKLLAEHVRKMPPRQTQVPYGEIIEFAIASAMRMGEITRILWDDVDTERRTVIIRDRKDPKEKIGNHQTVPLLGAAFDIVMRQPRTDARIFPHSPDTISSVFPRMCQKLGIEDLHFHDFRHEGVSRLFEQGYEIQQVALVSGHKSWNMLQRYTQLKPESLHRD